MGFSKEERRILLTDCMETDEPSFSLEVKFDQQFEAHGGTYGLWNGMKVIYAIIFQLWPMLCTSQLELNGSDLSRAAKDITKFINEEDGGHI